MLHMAVHDDRKDRRVPRAEAHVDLAQGRAGDEAVAWAHMDRYGCFVRLNYDVLDKAKHHRGYPIMPIRW